jgi:uncharacterized membrane protein
MRPVRAAVVVDAPAASVFAFLANLRNHWRLTGRHVTLVQLNGNDGGSVVVHGPLGSSRHVRTTVVSATPPQQLEGRALLGARTAARVRWTILEREANRCEVTLEAWLERAGPVDRLLLACGGRLWLARLFRSTVAQLPTAVSASDRLAAEPTPAERVR